MPELHLKQPVFTYSPWQPFTKREKIQKFWETDNLHELNKACFADDAAYSDGKDLPKESISDKILKDRAYETARNHKYDGYQRAWASMDCKFFHKKNKIRNEGKWTTSWKIT